MPCFDARAAASDREAHRIACYMLATLDAAGWPVPPFAKEWWQEHKDYDKAMKRMPEHDKILAGVIQHGGGGS